MNKQMKKGKNKDGERIRVLFVISDLSGGGAERAVSTYLHHLDRSCFEPGLCLWRDIFAYSIPDDVPVWIMDKTRPWHAPRTVLRMARLITKWQPDIIFSLLSYVNLLTGLAIKISPRSPHWMPSVRNNPSARNNLISNWLWTKMRATWHIIGVLSARNADTMSSKFKIFKDRIKTIHNPIDFKQIDSSLEKSSIKQSDTQTIVTMGRLVEQKDHATLLKAIALVRKSQKIRLLIIGEGPLKHDLQKLAYELGIKEEVEFAGFVKNPFPYLADAELFVLSSKWEGLGRVLIEAMGCGTAVISTNCPYGPGEIIDHEKKRAACTCWRTSTHGSCYYENN